MNTKRHMNLKHVLLALLCATLLSACGFKLRGAVDLPYESIYISLPESDTLRAKLIRNIRAGSKTNVTDSAINSQATFAITGDYLTKDILSLNSAGRVREYQLVRTLNFRVADAAGRELIPPGQIIVRRDITFDDSQVLAKEAEEQLLKRDMEDDLVQQILRRLAASKPEFAPAQKAN